MDKYILNHYSTTSDAHNGILSYFVGYVIPEYKNGRSVTSLRSRATKFSLEDVQELEYDLNKGSVPLLPTHWKIDRIKN